VHGTFLLFFCGRPDIPPKDTAATMCGPHCRENLRQ
jgi:hypothetical protein